MQIENIIVIQNEIKINHPSFSTRPSYEVTYNLVEKLELDDVTEKGWYLSIEYISRQYFIELVEFCGDCWRSTSGHGLTLEDPGYMEESTLIKVDEEAFTIFSGV